MPSQIDSGPLLTKRTGAEQILRFRTGSDRVVHRNAASSFCSNHVVLCPKIPRNINVSFVAIKFLIKMKQFLQNNNFAYAKVQFYFISPVNCHPYTLVSLYSSPDNSILHDSSQTVRASSHLGVNNLPPVIPTSALVLMQPLPPL